MPLLVLTRRMGSGAVSLNVGHKEMSHFSPLEIRYHRWTNTSDRRNSKPRRERFTRLELDGVGVPKALEFRWSFGGHFHPVVRRCIACEAV
jgi:hypothetical protein